MSDAFSRLTQLCQTFEYEYFLLGHLPEQDCEPTSRDILLTNLPLYLVEDMIGTRLFAQWSVLSMFSKTSMPFEWSQTQGITAGDSSNRLAGFGLAGAHNCKTNQVLKTELDLAAGCCLPLATCGHRRTFLALLRGSGSSVSSEADVFFAAQHLFGEIEFIIEERNRSSASDLNPRELECLAWAAAGKTSSEIATIISLSEHTVNHYLNSCCKKLNCVNRTQAVARAIRQRLIG